MTQNLHSKAIVIDNGSSSLKAGLADEETISPSVIIHASRWAQLQHKLNMNTSFPVERGQIVDTDALESLWKHILYQELGVDPKHRNILITEAPFASKLVRKKMLEIIFESLQAPSCYIGTQPILSLYASGRTSGLVAEIGHGLCSIVPVFDNYSFPHASDRLHLAGQDLDSFLTQLLEKERGLTKTGFDVETTITTIKERLCYVAEDFDLELQSCTGETKYSLPDGKEICIGSERFRSGEVLFQPTLIDQDTTLLGLPDAIFKSIMRCDIDTRRVLFSNILLSGGTSNLYGLTTRLEKELKLLIPKGFSLIVPPHQDRKYFSWIGGSMLASLSSFQKVWTTKEQYMEGNNLNAKT